MKALVYNGAKQVAVQEVPDAKVEESTDLSSRPYPVERSVASSCMPPG